MNANVTRIYSQPGFDHLTYVYYDRLAPDSQKPVTLYRRPARHINAKFGPLLGPYCAELFTVYHSERFNHFLTVIWPRKASR